MIGTIVVGGGGASPPPSTAPTLQVPSEYPSIAAAVAAASPGSIVQVAPGRYDEEVEVATPRLTIEGASGEAAAVILDGGYRREVGIAATADGLVVRGLTVQRYLTAGVSIAGVGSRAEDVRAVDNEGTGVQVGSGGLVQRIDAMRNRTGIHASGAGFVVRDSRLDANRAGIVVSAQPPASSPASPPAPPDGGGEVIGNTVMSGWVGGSVGTTLTTGGVPAGVGIWLDGAWGVRVVANTVETSRLGIVLTAGSRSTRAVEVVDNRVAAAPAADLAYDGIGVDVCFAGNRRPDGSPSTAEPALLLTVSHCARPHMVGIPDPIVPLLLWAA